MSHPYYAITGTNGTFRIDGLPPGSYQLVAWHQQLGSQTVQVTVGADGAASADLTFRIAR